MITSNDVKQLIGATVYDTDGKKVGSVGQVYLDNRTEEPQWVTVKTGLFGTKETFVPLDRANLSGDRVEVPYQKNQVKDAPRIDENGDLTPDEENALYRHYGLIAGDDRTTETRTPSENRDTGTSNDTSGVRGRHEAGERTSDDAMTRSEERLVAGTRTEAVGKARLRKHVVTEEKQVTVPVRREEVRLEHEPVTDGDRDDAATTGPGSSESEHGIILHAERPVVGTETVPVERVRLGKETVTDKQSVSGEVRKERIEFQGDDGRSS